MIPYSLRPDSRKTFKAYDGMNNLFNLAYEMLSWKVQHALVKAKLEPYLGFLHSIARGKPSLICDFQELYRYLVDDFIIGYSHSLHRQDFTIKTEIHSGNKKGKREYLNNLQTQDFIKNLSQFFQSKVSVPRVRRGAQQEIETLINEEALLFAQYLTVTKKSHRKHGVFRTERWKNGNKRIIRNKKGRFITWHKSRTYRQVAYPRRRWRQRTTHVTYQKLMEARGKALSIYGKAQTRDGVKSRRWELVKGSLSGKEWSHAGGLARLHPPKKEYSFRRTYAEDLDPSECEGEWVETPEIESR